MGDGVYSLHCFIKSFSRDYVFDLSNNVRISYQQSRDTGSRGAKSAGLMSSNLLGPAPGPTAYLDEAEFRVFRIQV